MVQRAPQYHGVMRRLPNVLVLAALSGCSSAPPVTSFTVPADQYPAAFQATKDVLREFQFEIDRVDARTGVITAWPRASSGFATPWIPHGSSFGDGIEGVGHFQTRTVRVSFAPMGGDGTETDDVLGPDLRGQNGPIEGQIDARVRRISRPGRRADANSAKLMSFTLDPRRSPDGKVPVVTSEFREDRELSARLARRIEELLASNTSSEKPDENGR